MTVYEYVVVAKDEVGRDFILADGKVLAKDETSAKLKIAVEELAEDLKGVSLDDTEILVRQFTPIYTGGQIWVNPSPYSYIGVDSINVK